MVKAKLYGFVNIQVKKEVYIIIKELCKDYDLKISDLLIDVLSDKQLITIKLEAKKKL